jgi:hypothetical protein
VALQGSGRSVFFHERCQHWPLYLVRQGNNLYLAMRVLIQATSQILTAGSGSGSDTSNSRALFPTDDCLDINCSFVLVCNASALCNPLLVTEVRAIQQAGPQLTLAFAAAASGILPTRTFVTVV